MKTRLIHTKIWQDEWFYKLKEIEKLLFIYLITNDRIGFTGAYECPDRLICFDVGITLEQLEKCKERFFERVIFKNGWIIVLNSDKYNIFKGLRLDPAVKKEKELLPEWVIKLLESGEPIGYQCSIDTSITYPINNNTNNISNKKKENSINYLSSEECYQELQNKFPNLDLNGIKDKCESLKDYCVANGKKYKNYLAFARNAIRKDQSQMPKKQVAPEIKNYPEKTPEERAKIQAEVKKIKAKFPVKDMGKEVLKEGE